MNGVEMRKIAVSVLVLAVFGAPAFADTITTTAGGNVGGVIKNDSDSTSTFNSPISATVTYNGSQFANADFTGPAFAKAEQNLGVLGAKGSVEVESLFADGTNGPHTMSAANTLVSTATAAGTYNFALFITGAELQNISFAGTGPLALITTSLSITLDLTQGATTTTLFSSTAVLKGSVLVESGTSLGATAFGGPTDPGYSFSGHFQNLGLGALNAGDFVTYRYAVSVTGPGFETGGLAWISDPNNLSGGLLINTGTGGPGPDPVPEPSSVLLVIAGLGVWTLMRRRRRT